MNTVEFLLQLRSLGIEIRMRDDRLVCNAPKGVLIPELRDEIAARKKEIIDFLRAAEKHRSASLPPIVRRQDSATALCSFSQERMWFMDQLEPNAIYNNLPVAYRLQGPLDKDAFRRTLNDIVMRHEPLRTTFSAGSGSPVQVIHPQAECPLTEVDFSHLSESSQQVELDGFFTREFSKPIDISRLPLFRVFLIKERESQHVLFFVCHHIIWDGWSYDVFLHELDIIYAAHLSGEQPALPEPEICYGDYCAWLRAWMQGAVLEEHLAYWREHLDGAMPGLALPADRLRPPVMNYAGAREMFALAQPVLDALEELGRPQGATLYMVLMAIFEILLFRYTFQETSIIGFPVQGRMRPELENLIGYFVNTLVLKTRMHGDLTFRDVLARIRDGCLGAYKHQDTPFEKVVEAVNPPRDLSRTPLYQVLFSYQDARERNWKIADISVAPVRCDPPAVQTDLYFWVQNMDNELIGGLDYRTDLFHAATIERFVNNFRTLVDAVIAQPDSTMMSLPVMSDEESRLVLQEWNQTERPYPGHLSLPELFEAQAEKTPDAAAAVCGQERISYGELNARANRLARHLKGLGVGPEKLVGMYVERSLSMLVGLLGILKAGGAYVPLDPLFPKERLAFMLADAGVSVLVTQESLADELPLPAGVQAVCLDAGWPEIARKPGDNLAEKAGPEHPAYVIYTSGSTGVPKGVEITHRALVNFLCSMRDEPGIGADDVLLAVTTLSFDIAGLELFLPLIAGARVVIAPMETVVDGVRLAALLKESGATIMQATPVTWRMLLEAGWRGSKALKILCGGEAFPADLAGPLLERGGEVWNMYGPTETTIWSTVYRMRDKDGPVLIGRPIANTSIYILDDHMMPVPIGVAEELYIGGDGLARGYLNRPELTAERFVTHAFKDNHQERLYRTGDLARYCHDGNIECLGRADFQVKIRGYRIELGEIEAVLQNHPAVRSAVVAARDAGGGDKRLVAYLICEPGAEQPSAQGLRELARATLPVYMIPSAYVFLESFPLTPNGKIDRAGLPAPDAAVRADDEDVYTPPRNAIEMTIASVWQSLLQVKRVGIRDNFFDLGGHSLLALQLFARLEKIFHKQLPLATLFEAPTVERLAAVVESKDWKPSWASVVPIQPGGSKPLFFCVHGAGGNVLLYRDLARHMGVDQPFYGLQAKGLDGRHPLNTSIESMATDYIKEIRELQPEGPYYLGGYCMGGSIAFEMARQLVRQGQTVAFLALLDTQRQFKTDFKPLIKCYQSYQNIAFHIGNFLQADMRGKRGFLFEKVSEAGRRIRRRYDIARSEIAYALKLRVDKPLVLMEKINDRASVLYQPDSYPGKVTLFRPRTNYAGYNDPLSGWGNGLTAGVDVQQLSSYPAGMLVEPFVAELADKLKLCLENAEARS